MILECINFLSKIIMPIWKWVKINAGTFMALLLNLIVYYLIVKFVGYENFDKIDKIFTIGCFICTSALSYYFFSEWVENRNKIKEQKLKEKLIEEKKKNESRAIIRGMYQLLQTCSYDEIKLLKRFLDGGSIQIDHKELVILKNMFPRGFDAIIGCSTYMGVTKAFITPDFYYVLKSYFNNHAHTAN